MGGGEGQVGWWAGGWKEEEQDKNHPAHSRNEKQRLLFSSESFILQIGTHESKTDDNSNVKVKAEHLRSA